MSLWRRIVVERRRVVLPLAVLIVANVAALVLLVWPLQRSVNTAESERVSALADLARRLDLGARLELGPGELKSGGHRRDSILADALEAVVAAIHLDAGFETCRAQVLPWFEASIAALPVGKADKDAKTRLQEWLQGRQLPRPAYRLVETRGDDHARVFHVACETEQPALTAEAEASSLRAAEQLAAERLLSALEQE